MDKHYFIELLNKHLKGETTREEDRLIFSHYSLFKNDPDVSTLWREGEKKEFSSAIKKNIWENIEAEERYEQKKFSIMPRRTIVAAAAVLTAVCITAIFFAVQPERKKQVLVSTANQQKENRLIHLNDGSTVILNINAKLTYPASFLKLEKREVTLEGEAYFDIKHNPDQPFIVHTGNVKTTVLGTAFNIKAIPNEANITVSVTRGKVKISDLRATLGLLTKGQQIIYNKSKGISSRKAINDDANLTWKRQDIFLDDVTVEDAAKLLEERFNVTISFGEPGIKNSRFTTVFLKDENLEQVLKSICEFNAATYTYNKQNASVIISKISTQNHLN